MKQRVISPEQALSRAASLCVKCEQCSPDILQKFLRWGLTRSTAQSLIDKLISERYIDDERFARAYVHDKLSFSGWGRRKISQALWAKRLPSSVISEAIDKIDEAEYVSVARRVVQSKLRSANLDLSEYDNRVKLLRHAMQRGFESSVVIPIIRSLQESQSDESDS